MIKRQNSLVFLVIMTLCLGSLTIAGVFQPEFDLTEREEEILSATTAGMAVAHQFFFRCQSMRLNCRPASLLPVSPPPKYS